MTEPIWIRDDVVEAVHRQQLAEHGGADGVRDPGMLASALARPRNLFAYQSDQVDLADLAAAYAFGIAKNHPFIDGSKRTALVVCRTFLLLNGRTLNATQVEKYQTFLSLAEGKLSEAELAAWIRARLADAV